MTAFACPDCRTLDGTPLGGVKTLLGWSPFSDEFGKWHSHDPNRNTQAVRCGNDHVFSYVVPNECWCGWKTTWEV